MHTPGKVSSARSPVVPMALLFSALFMLTGNLQAANLLVDGNSSACKTAGPGTPASPFCQIFRAVAVANPGDVVDVKPGNYVEKVVVKRSGTATSPLKIIAQAGVTVTNSSYAFDLSGVNYVEVRGFNIFNAGSHALRAILCTNITIADNQISATAGNGLYIRESSNVTLTNNTVANSSSYGAYLYLSSGVTMSGGSVLTSGQPVSGQTRKGIFVSDTSNSTVQGVLAADNTDSGIYVAGTSTNVMVNGNSTTRNARGYTRAAPGIEIRGASGNTISGNVSYGNEDTGIQIYSSASNNLVVNNISYGNGDHGIDVLSSQSTRVIGNSVYNNVTAGINVEGSSQNAIVQNNVSVDNGINSPRTSGNIRIDSVSVTGVTLDNNLTWITQAGPGAFAYTWGTVKYTTLAALRSAVPSVELRGLESNPLWIDPASGDFRLNAGSLGIDSANSSASGQTSVDATGQGRVDDPGTLNTGIGVRSYDDRGALEYH